MSTKRMMWATPWLIVGTFGFFSACGDANSDDDDDAPGTTTGGVTTGFTGGTTGGVTSSANASTGTTGFGVNNVVTGSTNAVSTTGNTIIQMNDNCDNIEAEAGASCNQSGLVCNDAFGRSCVCGGSSRFPEGIWTCRGEISGAGGAPGAGGAQGAGGAAGAGN